MHRTALHSALIGRKTFLSTTKKSTILAWTTSVCRERKQWFYYGNKFVLLQKIPP